MPKEIENHLKGCTKHLNKLRFSHLLVYFRNELANPGGFALRTSLGKELSLDREMSGLTFVPVLDPTALKRHYEHPDAVLWPEVISLFLIKDKDYFHFNHRFF